MAPRELIDAWASIYANAPAIRSAVSFAHLGALLSGGGCAIAADAWMLAAARRGPDDARAEAERLHGVHRVVVTSLAIVVMSGLLLMAADFDAYVESTAFWIKMGVVAALAVNGALLMRASGRVTSGDLLAVPLLHRISMLSLALWFASTLMGAVLPNAL